MLPAVKIDKVKNNWFKRNISKRNLIRKDESKVSYMQIIGFVLIAIGIIYMTIYRAFSHTSSSEGMAISFFIIMLGMAFAFPSLLKGRGKEVSTMRIVVFMMVNVICLLLIKIGWDPQIKSLSDIGLDQYWMGVIAFVFGAKAAQSYFESKMAVPKETPKSGMATVEYSNEDIAKLAVEQNQQYLRVKFPNILSVSDAVHDLGQAESHVIALYIKDNDTVGIPDKLEVRMPDGSIKLISTEIIRNVGAGKLLANQKDSVITNDNKALGSICCIVKTGEGDEAIVTSGHVYSRDGCFNAGGFLDPVENAILNGNVVVGQWFFQLITSNEDVALVKTLVPDNDPARKKFARTGFYKLSKEDVRTNAPNVTLISNVSNERDAFILDYNTSWPIPYKDGPKQKSNVILIGSANNRDNSMPVSKEGDSGGCVFHKQSGALIGLILGRNNKFTWVLPVEDTFRTWGFTLT